MVQLSSLRQPERMLDRDDTPLSETWFDLRTWLRARNRLLETPSAALQGRAALGFSPGGFARFLWVVLPTALIAGGLMVANIALNEMPTSPFLLTAERLAAARVELESRVPPASREEAKRLRDATKAERQALHAALIPASTLFGSPQPEAAVLEQWAQEIVDVTVARARALPADQGAALSAYMSRRLAASERKHRFMDRWVQSGASNLSGLLVIGVMIWAVGKAFRVMVQRLGPDYIHVAKSAEVFLYHTTARQFWFLVVTMLAWVVSQLAFWIEQPMLVTGGMIVAAVASLLAVIAYWRSGSVVAEVLLNAVPTPAQSRAIAWRLVATFVLLQGIAAVWGAAFVIATDVYFVVTT